MGEYGMIHQDFWIDFEDIPVKEKLFLVYLFSNVRTNISGLYKIPLKVFTRDLRFSEKEVKEALRKAEELKFAYYDYDTSWVWVKGLAKRNMASEQQIKGIIKQVKKCESNILLKKFKEYYKEKGNFWQCFKEFVDTLSIPYHTLSPDSDSVSVSVTDTNKHLQTPALTPTAAVVISLKAKEKKLTALQQVIEHFKKLKGFDDAWNKIGFKRFGREARDLLKISGGVEQAKAALDWIAAYSSERNLEWVIGTVLRKWGEYGIENKKVEKEREIEARRIEAKKESDKLMAGYGEDS